MARAARHQRWQDGSARRGSAAREFGFTYDADTSTEADRRTRPLALRRTLGAGSIVYVGLGHRHTPATDIQPWVDVSVAADGKTPLTFDGPWSNDAFGRLLDNAIEWGLSGSEPG